MFYMESNGETVAKISFVNLNDTTIDVNHTFVDERLRGQGIAGKLFEQIIKYAREENKKIVPTCSYVKAKMERNVTKYKDILAE